MAPLLMNNAFLADFRRVCWGECGPRGFARGIFCPESRSRSVLSAFVRKEGRSERLAPVGHRCLLNLARKLRPRPQLRCRATRPNRHHPRMAKARCRMMVEGRG